MLKTFPKKHLGQNFLIDENVKDRIIDACDLTNKDKVLEIGPGLGALTQKILQNKNKTYAIEKDPQLCQELRKIFYEDIDEKRFFLINADFLKYDLSKLSKNLKVIGNLPYNISSPIIEKLITEKHLFSDMFFTVQLEFAKRLAAKVNTKDYGSLSCFVQYYCDVKILFKIKNTCFKPIPKVTSCFIKLSSRKPHSRAKDEDFLFKMIRSGFQQRRKKIINSLSSIVEKDRLAVILASLKISEAKRAENLTLNDYVDISNLVIKNTK